MVEYYYDPTTGRFISIDDTRYLDFEVVFGYNRYAYCLNNPVMGYDPIGCFWDYVIDGFFILWGVIDIVNGGYKDWKNWVALGVDIVLAVCPFVTSGAGQTTVKILNTCDNASDLVKAYNQVDNVADVVSIRRANEMDFVDNGWDLVQGLNKTEDGFTISNRLTGIEIHSKFMGNGKYINRLNRVDGIDTLLGVVYELKPYNKRSIKKGIQQLRRYQGVLLQEQGVLYKMVLVLY